MFDVLFTLIDVTTLQNVSNMAGKFMDTIRPLIGAGVVLYAVYLAYQALFDAQNMLVMETLKFIGALAVCCTIALNTSFYFGHVVPVVLNSGDNIANVLLSPPATSTGGSMQIMFNKLMIQFNALWDSIDMSITNSDSISHGLLTILQCFFLLVGAIPFFAICVAYLMVAKIMVSFLLIIGPLFIMCAFFPSLRSFFQAWSGQCFNYILLSILFPVAFAMFTTILDVTVFSGTITLLSVFMSLTVFFGLSFVAIQIPTLSSSLSGGIGISGIVGSMSQSVGGSARAVKSTGGGISKILSKFKGGGGSSKPKGNNISAG